MQVQLNTDRNIRGGERLTEFVEATVTESLGRFADRVTRVEVHLSDENGAKSNGEDKKCVMEARPAGMQPVSVSHLAATVDLAVDGAAGKLARHLDHTFGKHDRDR